jgi:NAD(P)-dependent dehydrogenase (short-subunit alcohol dehydrogenase family)
MQVRPGTRALVTGASRGIGRALCRALAARGAILGLAARSTGELRALAAELPGEHHVVECDVTDGDSTRAAPEGFVERAGGLELLVANAGITHYQAFREQSLADALAMSAVMFAEALRHELARRMVAAIEADERHVFYPPFVRALGMAHGVSPKAGDALLRRLRGDSAAPRRG